jgi:hypothetical protein
MWRLLAIPLFVLMVVVHTAAHAQYYPYPPPYYAPGYYPPAYYPPAYYRPPPPPPPPAAYMYRGGLPYYGAPPAYSSANCGTPDQFKPCYR